MLILDAGTGVRLLGLELMTRFAKRPIEAQFLISHTHWDHIQGLPFFAPLYGKDHRFEFFGPTGIDQSLERLLKGQMDTHYFPVDMNDLVATVTFPELGEQLIERGDITIRTHYLHHTTLTLAYRIEYGGSSIVYATDHEVYRPMYTARRDSSSMIEMAERHDAEFVSFISGADLYIAEAQYTVAEYAAKVGWGHSTVEDIAAVAATAGVRHLVLFHHDPLRTDSAVDTLVTTARKIIFDHGASIRCEAAREGAVITV